MAGMGTLPSILTGLGALGTAGGLFEQWKIGQAIQNFFNNAPGRLQAGDTMDFSQISDNPAIQREMTGIAQNTPYGALQAEQARRDETALQQQRTSQAQTVSGVQQQYDPMLEQAQERWKTPAISQSQVDRLVAQLRGSVNTAASAAHQQAQSSAAGRGVSADALAAMKQQYSADASNQVLQGRLSAELQREMANIAAEQQRFQDLTGLTNSYMSTLLPQQNIATQLLGDSGVVGRLADYGLATDLSRLGLSNEATQQFANAGTALGSSLLNTGVGLFSANKMADATSDTSALESALGSMLGIGGGTALGYGGTAGIYSLLGLV